MRRVVFSVLLLTVLPAAAQQSTDMAQLYQEFCAVCHGDNGDGKSRAAGSLSPPPRDFTTPKASIELTRERMLGAIRDGRPGTAMSGWGGQLDEAQIGGLADFIREKFMVPTVTDSYDEGRRLFAENCSVCHGDGGDGNSRASGSMFPPPRNFTSEISRQELTRNRMIFSVSFGRANTAMPPWEAQLSRREIETVVDYIRKRFMGLEPGDAAPQGAVGHDHTVPIDEVAQLMELPFDGDLVGDPVRGETLYRDNCIACHGEHGDGQGPRAYFILPKPRNLNHEAARNSLNRPHLFESIALGRQGTEMPAWRWVLQPQDVADVAEYVFLKFIRADAADGDQPRPKPTDG